MFTNDCDDGDDESDWESLNTITTFDGLDSERSKFSTDYINFGNNITKTATNRIFNGGIMDVIATKATTPVSLLVESLVQQLCSMLEPDQNRSATLYNSICEKLHQMNLIDETFAMGEFEMMRSQYQRALYQLVSVARGHELPLVLQNVWPLPTQTTHGMLEWSRYFREFDELEYIAGGGFGKVYKARHKLDGIEYAVKKVTIKSTTINQVLHHLSEVKTLASLNHVNIVPYKAAWLEPFIANGNNISENESSKIKTTENVTKLSGDSDLSDEEDDDIDDYGKVFEESTASSSSDFIEFRDSNEDEVIASHTYDVDQERDFTTKSKKRHSISSRNKMLAKYNRNISIDESQPHLKLKWATLYIQMTLCQLTLREWLDSRNKYSRFDDFYDKFINDPVNRVRYHQNASQQRSLSKLFNHPVSVKIPENTRIRKIIKTAKSSSSSDEGMIDGDEDNDDCLEYHQNHPTHLNVVSDIFLQLLNGLHYIHSRGIVHHDIKPNNIFVAIDNNTKMTIQLGDFGLACPLQSPTAHSSQGFGTPLYAAPEQLNGECNPKSDIYSLGIILLELLIPFTTDMERVDTIKKIRSGTFPHQINENYSNLLNRLLSVHRKRPDTFQLVEIMNRMNSSKDDHITELQSRLSDQDIEIKLLRSQKTQIDEFNDELLKQKDLEINRLKLKILNLENKQKKDELLRLKENEIKRLKSLLKQFSSDMDDW